MDNDERILDFSTVLANSVHDMKNSLNILLCSLDEIIDTNESTGKTSTQKLDHLKYEANCLNINLIQLLSIYRIRNLNMKLQIQNHSLFDLMEEYTIINQELFKGKNLDLSFDCPPDLNADFDREMMGGVINNIINNAVKYANNKILLTAIKTEFYVELSIADNGKGYPAHMLCESSDSLSSVNFKTGSTGLGLYFASTIICNHEKNNFKGYLRCANDGIDGGGKITLYIP